MLSPYGISSRRLRLQTLVRLRWLAVAGQSCTVFFIAFVLNYDLPIMVAGLLIGALALANGLLSVAFPPTHRLEPLAALALLSFDLLQMGALLFFTGGLANPFAPLICVPVIISFASQPLRHSCGLLGLALVTVTALAVTPYPLPWHPSVDYTIHPVMQFAVWCSIVSMMGFAAFYVYRVSQEATLLADALAATELVLQRQNHLNQLDGLAAAAAHELGTPLATISVVAKEMERELGEDPRFGEDVHLLRSQSERCRDILRRLSSLPSDQEAHMRRLPLSSLIEEVVEPHRGGAVRLDVLWLSERSTEPVGTRNAGIIFGLGNLIENAVDYASDRVTVTVRYDRENVILVIEDDGQGYSADILTRIGEPYVTSRSRAESAGGLGLGLFIAKTLLERSGAVLHFENRETGGPGGQGARVRVSWPREVMDAAS